MDLILAEKLVKFIFTHMEIKSSFLSPHSQIYMSQPYELLKIIEEEGISPEQIDKWACEIQGINAV